MTQSAGRTIASSLIACLAVLFNPAGIAAGAEDSLSSDILQPQGLRYAGIYALREIDPGLTGAGVKFAVISRSYSYVGDEPQNDYRPPVEHSCFKATQFTFHDNGELPAGISPHSTAICSVLFGEDPAAFHPDMGQFYYQGATPQAQANIYEFWHFLMNNVHGHSPPDADIIAAGIGSPLEDWWTRGIESLAEHYGIVVVAGIGNGADAYHTVLYPGAGANAIGVGVVDSVNTGDPVTNLAEFALAYPEHSSFGPTGNGRSKPDIVAPGNCLAAEVNEPNGFEPTGDWSSFSTPIVAGAIGLLVQKARQDPDLGPAVSPKGGNCVIKSILLNSATKLPYWHKGQLQTDDDHFVPLDYIQGAGLLNAVGAYENLLAGQMGPGDVLTTGWDLNRLAESDRPENVYKITIPEPSDKQITATITWNRHYERVYPFKAAAEKNENLRLEIWAVDPGNPNNNYLLDYSDSSVDNVEHIYVAADAAYANYEIIVSFSGTDEKTEPDRGERYGLAWTVGDKPEADNIFLYDLNADGIVNEDDLVIALNNLLNSGNSPDTYLIGDIKPDGAIDAADLARILDQIQINRRADWHTEQEEKAG
ncbi:MAG: S8 family serine peptidase [Planctomycetota bacterium]